MAYTKQEIEQMASLSPGGLASQCLELCAAIDRQHTVIKELHGEAAYQRKLAHDRGVERDRWAARIKELEARLADIGRIATGQAKPEGRLEVRCDGCVVGFILPFSSDDDAEMSDILDEQDAGRNMEHTRR